MTYVSQMRPNHRVTRAERISARRSPVQKLRGYEWALARLVGRDEFIAYLKQKEDPD